MLIKNKKTILKLLIIFTLCPVIFLSKPNKVTATYPVFDAAHTAISTENASVNTDLWIKEHIFDPILWAVANMAVEKIADSTVDWINSGFEGGPSFVTDLDGFLTSVGDNALGEFLEGSELAFLCSPFSLDIKIALTQQFGGERESHCTLTDAFGNAEGALENALNNLGNDWSWEKFNSISQPQNNTYGAYLKGYTDFALKAAGKKDKEIIKSNWGGGFLSFDSCEDDTTEDICNENGCKTITVPGRCTTKTPGTTINESLTKVLGLGNDKLVIADEMDEIIGALLNQLVKSVFSSTTGLFDSNPSDNGFSQLPSSVIEKLIDVIEVKIKTEEDYREWKQKSLDAVNLAENYIDALISCWQSCPIEPPDEESQIASIESKVSALEATKLIKTDPFQESLRIDINSATININNKLQLIIDRINTATGENGEADPNEILTISNDFNNLIGLHTSSDVFEAQYEFENSIQFKMNTIISNMLTEKTSCEESGGTFLMCTSLSVLPTNITEGESSIISWTTLEAISGSINLNSANVITMNPIGEGSASITPSTTTTYTATLTNEAGETNTCKPITITVTEK